MRSPHDLHIKSSCSTNKPLRRSLLPINWSGAEMNAVVSRANRRSCCTVSSLEWKRERSLYLPRLGCEQGGSLLGAHDIRDTDTHTHTHSSMLATTHHLSDHVCLIIANCVSSSIRQQELCADCVQKRQLQPSRPRYQIQLQQPFTSPTSSSDRSSLEEPFKTSRSHRLAGEPVPQLQKLIGRSDDVTMGDCSSLKVVVACCWRELSRDCLLHQLFYPSKHSPPTHFPSASSGSLQSICRLARHRSSLLKLAAVRGPLTSAGLAYRCPTTIPVCHDLDAPVCRISSIRLTPQRLSLEASCSSNLSTRSNASQRSKSLLLLPKSAVSVSLSSHHRLCASCCLHLSFVFLAASYIAGCSTILSACIQQNQQISVIPPPRYPFRIP